MNVLSTTQRFQLINGGLKSNHTHVVFLLDGTVSCGKSALKQQDFHLDEIEDIQPIPPEAYMPLLPLGLTVAANATDSYIKRPNLTSFGTGADLNKSVL